MKKILFLAAAFVAGFGAMAQQKAEEVIKVSADKHDFGKIKQGVPVTTYFTITNTSDTSVDFELLRYLDGDLQFDGSLIDGGGRLINNGLEILFETDNATGNNDPTTFVGITGEGGLIPTTNRYEINSYPELRSRIIAGGNLNNVINGDGSDADQFIDAGKGYDVTLALRNLFTLGAGNTTTQKIYGSRRKHYYNREQYKSCISFKVTCKKCTSRNEQWQRTSVTRRKILYPRQHHAYKCRLYSIFRLGNVIRG